MVLSEIRVLVVDDVNAMRVQIRDVLKDIGFLNVTVASNGEEAKKAIEDEKYQLILADWQMAPTNGIELLQHIRQHPQYKEVAFVMVTAEGTKDLVVDAIQKGVDNYVLKPVTPADLSGKVIDVLSKKKLI